MKYGCNLVNKFMTRFFCGMQVEEYYFHHYAVHFAYSFIGQAMRSIPSVMSWDDHDIFDGWGSYPTPLQESEVFQVC